MTSTGLLRAVYTTLILWILSSIENVAAGPTSHPDPYKVLGVSKDATQDEIRRQYRKLCLQLHPDKNVNKAPRERDKREELFKRVQDANTQIGDEVSRQRYDQASSFSSSGSPFGMHTHSSSMGTSRDAATEAFHRAYFGPGSAFPPQRRTPFYFNGIDISELFSSGGPFSAGPATFWGMGSPLKSVYVQKVKVPLQDLYHGCYGKEFVLRENLWKRYRAAFRGGVGFSLLYQGILFSLPVLRVSVPASLVFAAALFHANLPRPNKRHYEVDVQTGWKGGTRLTFKEVEPGFDVVFVLEEEKHSRFVRHDNDLMTSIAVTASEARDGCSINIEPLHNLEGPITVRLRPHEVTRSGQQVFVKGRGWPRRKGSGIQGDLIVTVHIVPDRSRRWTKRRPRPK